MALSNKINDAYVEILKANVSIVNYLVDNYLAKLGYNDPIDVIYYLADNLSTIKVLLYCLAGANVFILLNSLFNKKEDREKKYVENNLVIQNENVLNNVSFEANKEQNSNNTEEL